MSFSFSATSSSSAFYSGAHTIFVTMGMPPPPQSPADPGFVPPAGSFIMRARRLADGSWYVPGYKQRSLALGASRG